MLTTQVMSEEDEKNYLRPTIFESLRKVLAMYGLGGVSRIYYNGEDEVSKLLGFDSNTPARNDIHTEGIFENKAFITVNYEKSPINNDYNNSGRMMTESPIFFLRDEKVGIINIYPGFEGIKVNVSVNLGFNSSKLAKQFVRRLNDQTDRQMGSPTFDSITHLIVNPGINRLLENIHGLLVKNDPTTPSLLDWFNQHGQAHWTTISNPIGNHLRLAVPIKFTEIRLQFTEANLQVPRRASVIGKWEVEMNYSFYFNNHTHWELEYPLNIYQDQINEEFIPVPKETFHQAYARRGNTELNIIRPLLDYRRDRAPYYYRLPAHDPFVFNEFLFTKPFYQVRLKVKEEANQIIVPNIFELPDLTWHESVKNYIKRVGNRVFERFNGPIFLTVLSNRTMSDPEQLSFDEEYNIILNREPAMFNTHRFLINLDLRISDWKEDVWKDMIKHPEDAEVIELTFPWYDFTAHEEGEGNQLVNKDNVIEDTGTGIGGPVSKPVKGSWLANKDKVIENIDIGINRAVRGFNNYSCELDLFTYNLNP